MSDNPSPNTPYRIANVTVNSQLNTINSDGNIIRLEPKAMLLLEFLVRRQGEVCSKQDILDEVWPKQLVADDTVTRLIFVLRNALGDDAKSPKFISTVPKKGYVFLVKATVIPTNKKHALVIAVSVSILFGLFLAWFNWPTLKPASNYEIQRSLPITHQDGREYSYATGERLTAYFHEQNNLTSLLISEGGRPHKVLLEDHWQKRSLLIIDNALFYIRFNSNQYQIVQQNLSGIAEVLFESNTPLFSLSFDDKTQNLIFNYYQNNDSTVLYKYSFMSGQVAPLNFARVPLPKNIYSHYYHSSRDTLYFVGIDGKKSTVYGVKRDADAYHLKIASFNKIQNLSRGKTASDLLVVGTYQFSQGIWHVSLESHELSLLFSHPDNDITQVVFNEAQNALVYSYQGQRVDLKRVSLSGSEVNLPHLNSTLIDNSARYSPDGKEIYFTSNRSGDFELYSYNEDTSLIRKISEIKAASIWHYSLSNSQNKIAIVYSTDHIRLGILDVLSGQIIKSVTLDELKFPLGWSRDDRHIYISEHLSNIALYLYDAEHLVIKKKRQHIGLTAFESSPGEVIAFDYELKRFIAYNFNTEQRKTLSTPVKAHMSLAPRNAYINGNFAMLLYNNGMQKSVHRLTLSEVNSKQQDILVANLLQPGSIQDFSPDMSSVLLANLDKTLTGNIVALQLSKQ